MRNPAFFPPFFGSVPNLRVCARDGEKIKTKMQTNEEKEKLYRKNIKRMRKGQGMEGKASKSSFMDLGFVLLFTFLAYIFVLVPPFNETFLRIVFALPPLLFLPGYALISAMFPRKAAVSYTHLTLPTKRIV